MSKILCEKGYRESDLKVFFWMTNRSLRFSDCTDEHILAVVKEDNYQGGTHSLIQLMLTSRFLDRSHYYIASCLLELWI